MPNVDQQLFNIVFVVAGALGGWWMKAIWETLKELQGADKNLAKEVSDLTVLVAGQYVKAETFDRTITALFQKLDRIEDKLDHKADKS